MIIGSKSSNKCHPNLLAKKEKKRKSVIQSRNQDGQEKHNPFRRVSLSACEIHHAPLMVDDAQLEISTINLHQNMLYDLNCGVW